MVANLCILSISVCCVAWGQEERRVGLPLLLGTNSTASFIYCSFAIPAVINSQHVVRRQALGCRVEAHPEENFHTMVQRTSESAEFVRGRPLYGPERRSASHRPHRSSLPQKVGPLQQEAASLRAEDGECAVGTGFSHEEGTYQTCQYW